jgi:hypothetical protein
MSNQPVPKTAEHIEKLTGLLGQLHDLAKEIPADMSEVDRVLEELRRLYGGAIVARAAQKEPPPITGLGSAARIPRSEDR